MKPITFCASFPPTQSAIKRGSDGMRITLDIPESDVPAALGLLAMMSCALCVTIQEVDVKATKIMGKRSKLETE